MPLFCGSVLLKRPFTSTFEHVSKIRKNRLQLEPEYDFELLGIASSAKFHKLCWAVNNQLRTMLIKQPDYIIETSKGELTFLHFRHSEGNCYLDVFKNKSPDDEHAYLLPEFTHFDYVVKISNCFQTFASEELIKQLREVKYIEYIAAVSMEKLKSKDNFLS